MTRYFWVLVGALFACRFYAFRPFLDHPHLFRQADTAFYSLGFHRFGMNIFMPTAGWLGGEHVLLEFPLTEWIAAATYAVTGPTILVDRLVNIGFFLAAAFYLFKIVELVKDRALARFVTVVFLAEPLGIYYSRAVHVDFTAVCFAHALLYYAMCAARSERRRHLVAAVLAGSVAFAIKAPYAFYLIVPALYDDAECRLPVARKLTVVWIFALSSLGFVAWFAHSRAVNQQAPDLSVIPSYYKHVDRFAWYFGSVVERWSLETWGTVIGNVHREIATTVWWAAVPLGLVAFRELKTFYGFALAWSAGTFVYVVIFLTLNAVHNYYQIPFMAPFALWLGAAFYAIWTRGREEREGTGGIVRGAAWVRVLAGILAVAYAASSMAVAVQRFYRTDPWDVVIGEMVQQSTSENDLIVMAYTGAVHSDPSYLFYARRFGWSVSSDELSPMILETLVTHGATAVVTSTTSATSDATRTYLGDKRILGAMRTNGGQVVVHSLRESQTR